MNRMWFVLFITLSSLVVSACSAPPVLRDDTFLKDDSLVTGEPCGAPCFRGITPGETSWRDAVNTIQDDPQFAGFRVEEFEEDSTLAKRLTWADGDAQDCCLITTLDGETVEEFFSFLAPQMQLGDVIDRYGEPQYLFGEPVSDDQAVAFLIYEDPSVMLYIFVGGAATGEISPDSEVIGMWYVTPASITGLIANNELYRWSGYGAFADLIDGNFDVTPQPTVVEEETIE
jgi:hypothetical protein